MLYARRCLAVPAASHPTPGAKCLPGENTLKGGHARGADHQARWRLAAPGDVTPGGVENAVHRGRRRGGRGGTPLASLLTEDLCREERRMRHPPWALCQGLDTCRDLDVRK